MDGVLRSFDSGANSSAFAYTIAGQPPMGVVSIDATYDAMVLCGAIPSREFRMGFSASKTCSNGSRNHTEQLKPSLRTPPMDLITSPMPRPRSIPSSTASPSPPSRSTHPLLSVFIILLPLRAPPFLPITVLRRRSTRLDLLCSFTTGTSTLGSLCAVCFHEVASECEVLGAALGEGC